MRFDALFNGVRTLFGRRNFEKCFPGKRILTGLFDLPKSSFGEHKYTRWRHADVYFEYTRWRHADVYFEYTIWRHADVSVEHSRACCHFVPARVKERACRHCNMV